MGSFAYTCALSGLPIEAGDAVRYMLVTQNPYNRGKTAAGLICSLSDVWFPRTFPLRGEYNDYGGVDKLHTGPQADAWVAGFKVDLCEKGWGNNACHDVPTRKNMDLGGLLGAVQEGRVHVRPDVGDRDLPNALDRARELLGEEVEKRRLPRVAKGIPTRQRVENALVRLGHKIAEGYRDGMLVNRVDANTVRVRSGDSGNRTEKLAAVRDALAGKWAGAVCCGTGNYADDAELLLRPLPGVRRRSAKKRKAALCVSHAMIREDVWQAICGLTLKGDYWKPVTVDSCRKEAAAAWKKSAGTADEHRRFMMRHDAGGIAGDAIPFTVGLGTHWWAMVEAHGAGKVTDAERDDFVRTAGELAFIQQWMAVTRCQWRPSTSCGPQFGEWAAHAAMLGAFQALAGDEAERQAKERSEG